MSLNWHSQLCQPVCQRLALSVGPVANDVPRWIVVAHPDLPAPISSNGAANRSGLLPYNLRVMAADASTGVAPKIVSARLAGPIANHLGWRRSAPGDGIEVLPIAVVRTVEKVASGDQMVTQSWATSASWSDHTKGGTPTLERTALCAASIDCESDTGERR